MIGEAIDAPRDAVYLRDIAPYGDTFFNYQQVDRLRGEIALVARLLDPEDAFLKFLPAIEEFLSLTEAKHYYVQLVGD